MSPGDEETETCLGEMIHLQGVSIPTVDNYFDNIISNQHCNAWWGERDYERERKIEMIVRNIKRDS